MMYKLMNKYSIGRAGHARRFLTIVGVRSRYTAMTLVEIVISLTIIAIIVAISSTAIKSPIERSRLQQSADRLIADLRYTRSCAIRDQETYSCQLDFNLRSYTIPDFRGIDYETGITICLAASPYLISELDFVIPDAGSNHVIDFDLTGQATPSGQIKLYQGDKYIAIEIRPGGTIEQIQ